MNNVAYMTAKDAVRQIGEPVAYYSGWGGIDIYYADSDICICVSNAWNDRYKMKCHKVKWHYDNKNDNPYIIVKGHRIHANEIIRRNAW
jgi:hypothetical protein